MKKYKIIVADPPWEIQKVKKRVRPNQIDVDYSMMSIQAISDLPVNTLTDDTCILFLSTIDKYLHQARQILEAWGFNYHLTMSWDKLNGLAMYGFKRQSEFILVGLKGKHEVFPVRETIPTSFHCKSTHHSAKPDMFYRLLDVLPYNPRLDMFARTKRNNLFIQNNWDVWGNEVENDIKL